MTGQLDKQAVALATRMSSMRAQGVEDAVVFDTALRALIAAGVSVFSPQLVAAQLRAGAESVDETGATGSRPADRPGPELSRMCRVKPLL